MTGLQAALPREMYVDPAAWRARARAVLLRRVDLRRPGRRPRARRARAGGRRRRRRASRCCVTRDDDGALHAAYNVCRHRGSQLVPDRAGQRAAAVRRRGRCAAPTTRGPTPSTARCCGRRTPTDGDVDPAEFSLHPVGVETWGGFVFVHLDARTAPRRSPTASAGATRDARPTTASATLVTGADAAPTRSRPTGRCSPRTTTSATTAARCTPSCPGWCRRSPAAAPGLDWDDGIPHREGAWTFTMTGTTTAVAAARARRGRADAAQGRARLPEPDAVVLGRPRRGVRAAAAGRRPHRGSSACCCSRATRSRPPTSTRPTPATSGTWSTGRTGRSASRCSAGCRRAPTRTAGSRRWRTTAPTSGAGCCPRLEPADDLSDVRLRRRRPRRARQRRGAGSWPGAATRVLGLEQFELGHTPRRLATTPPDPAAQLPHARRTSG